MEVNMNQRSFVHENCSWHCNFELKTWKHILY